MCNVALLKLEDDCCGHGWPTLTHSDWIMKACIRACERCKRLITCQDRLAP